MSNVKAQIPNEIQSLNIKVSEILDIHGIMVFGISHLFDIWILKFEILPS
jgi:hypothetical protein